MRRSLPVGEWSEINVVPHHDDDGRLVSYRAFARYRDLDGRSRQVERRGQSMGEARGLLREALEERGRSAGFGSLASADRFEIAAEMWLDRVRRMVKEGRRSPATLDVYERYLRVHVLPGLGSLRLRELTTPLLDRFVMDLSDRKGTAVARTCRTIVSGVMGLAVRYGALTSNPVRDIDRVESRARREPRALTAAERDVWFHKLAADERSVETDVVDLTLVLLATGLRIGEVLALRWSEIDLNDGVVSVTSTIIRVRGQGLLRKPTKTRSGQRQLILPAWALEVLRGRWMKGMPDDLPVFASDRGTHRDPNNVRRDLRLAARRAGFEWVTSHNFRKTTATILDDAGMSARMIADQLGHARPSMTQDVYLGRKAPHQRVVAALDLAGPNASRSKSNRPEDAG